MLVRDQALQRLFCTTGVIFYHLVSCGMANYIESNQIQLRLFEEIYGATSGKSQITRELIAILGCSRASLYRKRAGTTALTAQELVHLANHFSVSIDALRNESSKNEDVVVCTTLPAIQNFGDIAYYLESTKKSLEEALTYPGAQLYFSAKDIPLYRYLRYPGLSSFRFFLWMIENLRRNERFDPHKIPQELLKTANDIAQLSDQLKITEFWLPSSFNNLIGQLRLTIANGTVSTRLKKQLVDELHHLLDALIFQIRSEETFAERPYRMVLCQYLTLSDGALVELTPQKSEVLFAYSSINYLRSSNPNLIKAFKRGLRYHMLEGQTLGPLEESEIVKFEQSIRNHINSL